MSIVKTFRGSESRSVLFQWLKEKNSLLKASVRWKRMKSTDRPIDYVNKKPKQALPILQ